MPNLEYHPSEKHNAERGHKGQSRCPEDITPEAASILLSEAVAVDDEGNIIKASDLTEPLDLWNRCEYGHFFQAKCEQPHVPSNGVLKYHGYPVASGVVPSDALKWLCERDGIKPSASLRNEMDNSRYIGRWSRIDSEAKRGTDRADRRSRGRKK